MVSDEQETFAKHAAHGMMITIHMKEFFKNVCTLRKAEGLNIYQNVTSERVEERKSCVER